MDISSSSLNLGNQIATATMKKALDQQKLEGQQVLALIESAAPSADLQTTQTVNASAATDRIGTLINTTA